ncbi:hypothetical protein ACGRHY_21940 [Streptomyces sp. HK10]|uniref:hypothetical protein n=1 Tax=Streptomyces sp. HK10 TaxID=3373255 RepID=UPI003747E984
MTVRAVRGAVRLDRDEAGHEAGHMDERVPRPLTGLPECSALTAGHLAGVRSTATPGPRSGFPAAPRKDIAR